MSPRTYTTTIRLDAAVAEQLATIAEVDELPIIDVLRRALQEHIAARTADPQFRQALEAHIEREQQMLAQPRQETTTP